MQNLSPGLGEENPQNMLVVIVSPDESRGYLGFSMVTLPPPQRFPFGRDKLKNIVRPFKFGMWVCMGNVTNAIVLWP